MSAEAKLVNEKETVADKKLLKKAVLGDGNKATSKRGLQERMFTAAFSGFVYPQIWEDPEIDIPAMKIDETTRIMTICSGGCNMMNYLTESPASVTAVDLNPHHVALGRLKIAALKYLPDYESFFMFFGCADNALNIENYDKYIKPHLDKYTLDYWEKKVFPHGRRINLFKKNLYRFGLLGKFIGMVHFVAKIYGQDPRDMLKARDMEEQKIIFDRTLAPLFDKKFVKMMCGKPESLYGLGIPPSQFDELNESAKGDMASLLKARLERMACQFPIQDNYFAWQAFGRCYDRENRIALPRYLKEENYETLKANIENAKVEHCTITEYLDAQGENSVDAYVFLDAQDWMNDDQLNDLWEAVLRSATDGARVIFRTAGDYSPLTEGLKKENLSPWEYDESLAAPRNEEDRSSIYGGFHTYTLNRSKAAKKTKAA
jgi:S-adenosylmethionine-diacylglycerol 3-amino-3-carboxypropyl transferase